MVSKIGLDHCLDYNLQHIHIDRYKRRWHLNSINTGIPPSEQGKVRRRPLAGLVRSTMAAAASYFGTSSTRSSTKQQQQHRSGAVESCRSCPAGPLLHQRPHALPLLLVPQYASCLSRILGLDWCGMLEFGCKSC